MTPIEKQYIQTSGGQIHVRMTARHDAVPLVLLHQTASSSAMYEAVMPVLANDFWVIAPDTPGFGNSFSPVTRPSISFYAAVLWEALDGLGISTCHLFGHHTGAAIAVQMAHDAPQRVARLALSGPPLLTDEQVAHLRNGLHQLVLDEDGRFLTKTWQRLRQKSPDALLPLILRETLLTLQAADNYPRAYEAVFAQPLAAQLAGLCCPTLLMAGENDSLRDCLESAYALLPDAVLHRLPDADGYICDRQPERVASIVRQFLMEGLI